VKNGGGSLRPLDLWHQHGVNFREIQQLVPIDTESKLNNWRDLGLIYSDHSSGFYYFLIPQHYYLLKDHFSNLTHLQRLALETTLLGWQGFSSAGQSLKPFLNHKLSTLPPFSDFVYNEEELITSARPATTSKELMLSSLKLEDLIKKIFCTKQDFGLDACAIGRPGNKKCYPVHVAQHKMGEKGKKITPGNRPNGDDSKEFAAILHKAANGWSSLHAALQAQFPKTLFKLASFTLFTSKVVDPSIKANLSIPFVQGCGSVDVNLYIYDVETFQDVCETELKELGISL
jgi:hypothetical protein